MTAPHVSKYLFGDDKTILIFFATEERHNQKLGSSYPETKIFYISAGKPGWNISLSSYVILPAITINYIRNVSKKEIDILLAEDMYDMLNEIAKDFNLDCGRPTAAAEQAVFMAQSVREKFEIKDKIFGLSRDIAKKYDFEDSVCIYIRLKAAGS